MLPFEKPLKIVVLEARDFCSGATGRNGGHLTANLYRRMHKLSELYGAQEATKAFALEHYTTASIVKIIEANGWAEDVDLVAGGHLSLAFTQEEFRDLEMNLRAAEKAGVEGVENVELLDAQCVNENYGTPYPAYRVPGYNLWPLKLVTKLYQLAQAKSNTSSSDPKNTGIAQPSLTLHTRTPVRGVLPASGSTRRWIIDTPRGMVSADYVVHATNAYASHLLPHLAGPSGIVPTRGQVIATKSAVPRQHLWNNSWHGNYGYEYWFARPCPATKRPLIILGGGREAVGSDFGYNIADDSSVNAKVSATLRSFLPAAFPGQFDDGTDPDMEWTGIMVCRVL
ncbi:hypothetical protein FRB95_012183 [Tulasnella sp. JGI-2019a]|nr:hypothetical protein FRB95_012183 [Tulasnella sp. JGI-2019a]